MKILLLTYYFPPEIGAASHLFYELAESLAERKHAVQVLTGFPAYNFKKRPPKYRSKFFMKEKIDEVEVIRIGGVHIPFSRKKAFLRGIEHFWLAFVFFLRGLFINKTDLILLYSPPLTLGITGWLLGRIKKVPFIVNVQDLFPQNAIDLGLLKNKFLIKVFENLEKFVYKKANFITVHSEGNKKHIIPKIKDSNKVKVIPNWVDTDSIKPGIKINDFARRYNLGDKFIVSFAGVMGYSQGVGIIVKAAKLLEKESKILFILVGEGPEKEKLRVESKGLKNIKFIPMQPRIIYPQVLAASDISLVTLKKNVLTPVVPSKILSIMAAGRPLVASLSLNGDAPRLIRMANCGICVETEDAQALARAVLKLYNDSKLRETLAKNGRLYAEKHLSKKISIAKYEKLFKDLTKTHVSKK